MDKGRIRIGFVTANPEINAKLDILRNEYGISLNDFFIRTIAEKLKNLGCSFDDKSFAENELRKPNPKKPKSDLDDLRSSLQRIQMRRN